MGATKGRRDYASEMLFYSDKKHGQILMHAQINIYKACLHSRNNSYTKQTVMLLRKKQSDPLMVQ